MTDVGRQRKHNEDHVLLRPELDLYVVADGMGGHNAGDVASRLTTTSLRNFYEAIHEGADVPTGLITSDEESKLEREAQRLAAAIRKSNRDVHEISQSFRQHHGMGSTVVGAAVDCAGARIHVGHVGDSRCYRFRQGAYEQLTRDHSLINDAIALKPDLTPEELARLPKNIITRALGMREDVKVDLRSEDILPGDVYLLCSDGLSGMLTDDEMLAIIDAAKELREAAEQLVASANEAGGNDNITALLLRFESDDSVEAEEPDAADRPDDDGRAETEPDERSGDPPTRAEGRRSRPEPTPEAGLAEAGLAEAGLAEAGLAEAGLAEAGDLDPAEDGGVGADGGPVIEAVPVVLCVKCGAEIEGANRFCTECGEPAA